MNTLLSLEALQQIEDAVSLVTQAAAERCGKKLSEPRPGETVLGTIHNEYLRSLFVVCGRLDAEEDELNAKAKVAELDDQEEELRDKAAAAGELHQLATRLFWTQVAIEMHGQGKSLGVRRGFVCVVAAPSNGDSIARHVIERLMG